MELLNALFYALGYFWEGGTHSNCRSAMRMRVRATWRF
jgi:hypothetical protein